MGQRFTAFQIWATLVVMTVPIAFLEVPKRQLKTLGNNAWIAVALSLLFGFLIYSMYLLSSAAARLPCRLCWKNILGRWWGAACRYSISFPSC